MYVERGWPPAKGMPRKDEYRTYAELLQLHSSRRETSSSVIQLQSCERRTAKDKSTKSSQRILWEDVIL
jgi:hypothetical protein